MTTERVQLNTGLLFATLRDLQMAICAARSDGPQLAERFAKGRTKVTIDEAGRVIEFAVVTADGTPDFIEFIVADWDKPDTWGHLGSLGVGAGATHH